MSSPLMSARWIQEFNKHLYRRQHIILYGNIHDQFLWRGAYHSTTPFLTAYFQDLSFGLVMQYDPIDGFTYAQPEMRGTLDRLTCQQLQGSDSPSVAVSGSSVARAGPGGQSAAGSGGSL